MSGGKLFQTPSVSWRASNRKTGVVRSQTELAPVGKPKASSVMGTLTHTLANHRSEKALQKMATAGLNQTSTRLACTQVAGRRLYSEIMEIVL